MEKIKSTLANFLELTRGYSLGVTFASCFVIFSYAYYSEEFSYLNLFLLVIALCCVHMGANLFDDYIDVKSKLKEGMALEDIKFNSYVPKARLILNKTYSLRTVEVIFSILFLIAILIGFYFIDNSGWIVGIFAFIGGILTLFYPISSKHYLAEIIVGLIFGPLMITGGYYALCQDFNINLFFMSIAIFFATLLLLHCHSLMDWEFDIKDGKKTLCTFFKTKQNAIKVLKAIIFTAYAVVFLGVIFLRFNPHTLYVFLTLPIATKLIESMNDYINIKDTKFIPRWYFGPFENWNKIKENNIDFFMYRFYLARNFSLLFAFFASLGAMV